MKRIIIGKTDSWKVLLKILDDCQVICVGHDNEGYPMYAAIKDGKIDKYVVKYTYCTK